MAAATAVVLAGATTMPLVIPGKAPRRGLDGAETGALASVVGLYAPPVIVPTGVPTVEVLPVVPVRVKSADPAPVAPAPPVVVAEAAPVVPAPAPVPPVPDVAASGAVSGAEVVALAAQYAGVPYVYGGEDPSGFDCSGLVQWVFGRLGVNVPRTTQAQYESARHVNAADRQLGDLIFFGDPSAIYHVGIYAGNGTMWVAPRSGDVVKLQTIWTANYHVGRF